MIKYIITFVLVVIFLMYSIMILSKGMDNTICTEPFVNDNVNTFLRSVEAKECASNQKLFLTNAQLQCLDKCSQSNVIFTDSSNICSSNWCKLSASESNYSATVQSRCFVGDSLYELNSNVYIGCDSDQVPTCSNCEITDRGCTLNAEDTCEKIVIASNVPYGYSRCKLNSSVYVVDHLESHSNFVIGCSNNECAPVSYTHLTLPTKRIV